MTQALVLELSLRKYEVVFRSPSLTTVSNPESTHVPAALQHLLVRIAQARADQPHMVDDYARAEHTPQTLVATRPARAPQENWDARGGETAHDDAQAAHAPLVGLVVHEEKGAAQAVLEIVEVYVMQEVLEAEDSMRGGLDIRECVVHHRADECCCGG